MTVSFVIPRLMHSPVTTQLRTLYLYENALVGVPPCVYQLTSLRHLDLGGNMLTQLDPQVRLMV